MSAAAVQSTEPVVVALRGLLEGLVGEIESLRRVLEAAPHGGSDGPFLSVADAALERIAAQCDAGAQVAGGLPYGGQIGGADFVNQWCCPKALHSHVLAIAKGGAA